eukprot:8365720-Pyramimonas_sp.AAC.1
MGERGQPAKKARGFLEALLPSKQPPENPPGPVAKPPALLECPPPRPTHLGAPPKTGDGDNRALDWKR